MTLTNIYNNQRGTSLMALTVILCLSAVILLTWGDSRSKAQNLSQQIELSTLQELKHIKASLFAHANLKGFNSLTQPGNLPCPSGTPGGTTPASCLNAWFGYLPIESRSAVNHLRLAIHSKPNAISVSKDKSWRYAVSPQLIQPNELGWSQWVNWNQPSITVWHDGQMTTDVAIVVSEGMELLDGYTLRIWGAHLLIRTPDLKREVSNSQTASVMSTFNTWLQSNPEAYTHENLNWNAQTNMAQPKWADCQCSCTRTRCTCACQEDSWWTSNFACLSESETCQSISKWDASSMPKGKALAHVCKAQQGNTCVFKGSARPLSAWPVSSTLPVAAKGKACEQFGFGSCPLSINSTPCVCDFNWPSNSRSHLSNITIKINPGSNNGGASHQAGL